MPHTSDPKRIDDEIDTWYFDATPELVQSHLEARAMQRRVLLGCTLVGLVGVIILIAILAGTLNAPLTISTMRV